MSGAAGEPDTGGAGAEMWVLGCTGVWLRDCAVGRHAALGQGWLPTLPFHLPQMRHLSKLASVSRSTARMSHPTSISWASVSRPASRHLCPARNSG